MVPGFWFLVPRLRNQKPATKNQKLTEQWLARRLSLAEAVDRLIPIVERAVSFVNRRSDFGGCRLQAGGTSRLRLQACNLRFNFFCVLDEREIEAIDGIKLRLFDFHDIEEASIAIGRKSYTVFDLVEFLDG